MKAETKKAVLRLTGTAAKNELQRKPYLSCDTESSQKRQEKIAQRMAQIPKIHQAVYKSAVEGKSRKNAIKSFCLMCVGDEKEEVRLCTDLACQFYAFRPYCKLSNHSDNRTGLLAESKNIGQGYIG